MWSTYDFSTFKQKLLTPSPNLLNGSKNQSTLQKSVKQQLVDGEKRPANQRDSQRSPQQDSRLGGSGRREYYFHQALSNQKCDPILRKKHSSPSAMSVKLIDPKLKHSLERLRNKSGISSSHRDGSTRTPIQFGGCFESKETAPKQFERLAGKVEESSKSRTEQKTFRDEEVFHSRIKRRSEKNPPKSARGTAENSHPRGQALHKTIFPSKSSARVKCERTVREVDKQKEESTCLYSFKKKYALLSSRKPIVGLFAGSHLIKQKFIMSEEDTLGDNSCRKESSLALVLNTDRTADRQPKLCSALKSARSRREAKASGEPKPVKTIRFADQLIE